MTSMAAVSTTSRRPRRYRLAALTPPGSSSTAMGCACRAVLISPYVAPGSIIRPPQNPAGEPIFPFDHASIIATLHKLFELGPPMTPRVAAAPDLLCAPTLEQPENDGPEHVATHPRQPSRREARAHVRRHRNPLQRSIRNLCGRCPAQRHEASPL
jgi:phospholipase C